MPKLNTIDNDTTKTKGDLLVRGENWNQRLGVGANGEVLTADSVQELGVKWSASAGGGASKGFIVGMAAAL